LEIIEDIQPASDGKENVKQKGKDQNLTNRDRKERTPILFPKRPGADQTKQKNNACANPK
jgi:hypothetical protein